MSESNAELRNASNVDVYGLKVEGSTPILWVRDSHDVNLFGMGGGADAFPTGSAGTYYPPDFVPYAPSILRIERTPKFKLLNLMDAGRGGTGARDPPRPIGKFPLTPAILGTYDWPANETQRIISSMWAPWPGYAVNAAKWNLIAELAAGGVPGADERLTDPNDRPVAYMRGHGGCS